MQPVKETESERQKETPKATGGEYGGKSSIDGNRMQPSNPTLRGYKIEPRRNGKVFLQDRNPKGHNQYSEVGYKIQPTKGNLMEEMFLDLQIITPEKQCVFAYENSLTGVAKKNSYYLCIAFGMGYKKQPIIGVAKKNSNKAIYMLIN